MGFSVIMLFFSLAFFSYSISDLSLAEEGEELEDEENLWMINLDDYVVLTWVANTVEYLTALYLYVDDPYSATSVVLRYDSWLNALVLNSSIDANALGIWYNDFWEWVVWSVFVWWSGNKLYMNTIGILDEYWDWTGSRNWKNDSAVVIWWERNTAGQAWSVVVWWRDVSIGATQGLAVVWSDNVWVNNSAVTVVLWGKNVYFGAWAWHWFYAWYNLHWGYSNFLIWSWIDAQSAQHYSLNLGNTFAWSSAASWLAIKGWGLWWQRWFYVNSENGLWLNTSTPRLTFDARSWWPLKLKRSRWILDKEMVFTDDGSRILCDDEKKSGKFRWTVVYVQLLDDDDQFVTAWFCWCNGKAWTPLSNDTVTQYVCTNINSWDRKENCLGAEKLHNVITHTGTEWYQRWDEEANGWSWDWIKLNWTFWWVPGLLSWMQRECVYSCKVWYHPDTKSPQGWFTWDCVPCTTIKNWTFISPWTWLDDCQFACNAWYKYNWWVAPNERANKWCAPCNYWEWTTWMNQSIMCERCEYPIWISARLKNSDWSPMKFYSWSMWDAVAKTWTWEPYFRGFTNFSRNWKYGCDFDCASWFIYSFGWSEWSNTCTECWTGTYSDWWKSTSCSSCRNKPMWSISFSWTDISWKFHSSQNNIIEEKDVAWYTSKWLTWAMSCEWTCNPTIWLVKVKEWDNWRCKCPEGTHLESLGGKAQCVSNKMDVVCAWELWEYAIRGPHIFTWAVWNGSWTNFAWEQKYWTYSDVDDPSKLKACEWTCPHWYQRDEGSNNCRPILVGECKFNWTHISSDYTSAFWDNPNNLCSKAVAGWNINVRKVYINYYDDKKGTDKEHQFQYYPQTSHPRSQPTSPTTNKIKYLVSWTCEWFEYDPKFSASCYAYWDWPEAEGKCDNDRRSDWKANSSCATDFTNCNDYKSCPPIRNESTSSDWHWKTWVCPWVYGWKQSKLCHSCDDGYSWKNEGENGQGKCIADKADWVCVNPPENDDNMSFGAKKYVIPFDSDKNEYTPETMPYVLKASTEDLAPCEYACNTWYTWWYAWQKCMPLAEPHDCKDYPTNTDHIIFWPKTYSWVFTEWGYVVLTKTIFTYVGDEKTDNLSACEFMCDGWFYWDGDSCEGYDPVEVPPKCGSVSEDCPIFTACDTSKSACQTSCNEECYEDNVCEDCVDNCDENDENYSGCIAEFNECVSGYNACLSTRSTCIGICDSTCSCSNVCDWKCGSCEDYIEVYDENACTGGYLDGKVERESANKYKWSCSSNNKDKDWNDYKVTISCGQDAPEYYYCDDYHYEFGNAHPIGKRFFTSEPSTTANVLYANDWEAAWKSCSFACNEWFSLIDGKCKMCKQWVMKEVNGEFVCVEMTSKCPPDSTYNEENNTCTQYWNCKRWNNFDNSLPEHAIIPGFTDEPDPIAYFRPLWGGTAEYRRCYDDPLKAKANTCSFTCAPGFICSEWWYDAKCIDKTVWPFSCASSVHINNDSAYILKNPTVNTKTENYLFTYFEYIDKRFDSQDEFESYAKGVWTFKWEWCYYSCKSWYFYATSAPNSPYKGCYTSEEMNAYECAKTPNAWWYIEYTLKPKKTGQDWTYFENYADYEKGKSEWCAWTCETWSTAYNIDWKTVCLKKCPEGKYFSASSFYLGWCYSCAEWTVPNKDDLLAGIVPKSCRDICWEFPGTFYSKTLWACVESTPIDDPSNPNNPNNPNNPDPWNNNGNNWADIAAKSCESRWLKSVYISPHWYCILWTPEE